MSLSDLASLGSFISGIAVVVTLLFLLLQVRQNTQALRRAEANATQSQASAFRLAIVTNRDVAQMLAAGAADDGTLDAVDELRFATLLGEIAWSSCHIWMREEGGLFPHAGEWERGAVLVIELIATKRGRVWWAQSKTSFPAGFGRDVDKALGT
ncbi:MAG TPA: hypothetical protein VGG48_07110 [Rhizomicrobium sp.]|jgi:hypothetical protein